MAVLHNLLVRRADCRLTRCDTAVYLRLHLNYVAPQLHLSSRLRCSVVSWMENGLYYEPRNFISEEHTHNTVIAVKQK